MPGPAPAPCKPGTFKTANDLCGGLQKNSAGDASAKACAGACCGEAGCMTWQWLGGKTHGAGCWIGTCAKPGHPSKTWVGGQRVGPPPAPGPPSPTPPVTSGPLAEKYDDSSWSMIDVPHDFIINGTNGINSNGSIYSQSTPGSGTSYLPRNESYYRKHFKVRGCCL